MKKFFPPGFRPSFALISVLSLVSLAALSATAFLASARLERLASRPLADVTRLEMASSTGLAMAMSVLVQAGTADTFQLQRVISYWRTNEADDLGYLLVGTPVSPTMMVYMPAFSAATMTNALDSTNTTTSVIDVTGQGNYRTTISNRFATQWTNGFNASNSTNLTLLADQTSPPVAWIPIRQERRIRTGSAATTNVQVARMAFYVQDLQGLIDAERMGGELVRSTGTNPAEISLTNLSGTQLTDAGTVTTFTNTNNRKLYVSVGMLRSAGGLATNDLRYVATGLRSWGWMTNDANSFSNRIPPGILVAANTAYANAGQEKFDLNTYTNGNVNDLATRLRTALPSFEQRAGGLTNNNRFDYYNCLAANIVDYLDTNQTPSIQTGAGGYRGVEALPLVSEVAISFVWTNQLKTGVVYQEEIEVVHLVEFWNMFNKEFTGTVDFGLHDTFTGKFGISDFNSTMTKFIDPNSPSKSLTNSFSVELLPNEFRVYASPPIRYKVLSAFTAEPKYNGKTAATGGNVPFGRSNAINADNFSGSYSLAFNGTIYDQSLSYEQENNTTGLKCELSTPAPAPMFKAFVPALRLDTVGDNTLFGTGDIRMSYFMTNSVTENGPGIMNSSDFNARSSFGFRNKIWGDLGSRPGSTNRPDIWLDGGHANSSLGVNSSPGQDTRIYDKNGNLTPIFSNIMSRKMPSLAIQQEAPAFIADAPMTNIFDLGRIFDPIQWRTTLPTSDSNPRPTYPTNITSTSIADFQQGGGNTLRIGRPEHPRFAFTNLGGDPMPNMGQSAAAMLDLFRIGSVDSNSFAGGGKINLNTAPAPVLAALAGGVALTNDPSRAPASAPANANMTNAFVQGVRKFRQLYPFYSPSQLPFISTDYGVGAWTNTWTNTAVFGTNQSSASTNGLAGVTALNDAGREEWFSRIYGLSGVDSLNFRCYVLAQLTDANGNPRGAPYRKYYQIYTVPYPQTPAAFSAVVVEEGNY